MSFYHDTRTAPLVDLNAIKDAQTVSKSKEVSSTDNKGVQHKKDEFSVTQTSSITFGALTSLPKDISQSPVVAYSMKWIQDQPLEVKEFVVKRAKEFANAIDAKSPGIL